MMDLASRFVLVLGLGDSGLAMARWCARAGARVRVADTRDAPPALDALRTAAPEAEVRTGAFTPALLDGITLVAVSPGIDLREPVVVAALRAGTPVMGEVGFFAAAVAELPEARRPRVVAITGTNGKTTTTALAAQMLRAAGVDAEAAGNIGPSVLTAWLGREAQEAPLPACWVLELSSFQLETAGGFCADAAVVLNVSDDHLDRHGGLAAYAQVKAQIFNACDTQVLNRDDARVRAMARTDRAQITIGHEAPPRDEDFGLVERDGARWLVRGATPLLALDELPLAGVHNALNVQAALALGVAVGAPLAALLTGLREFRGLPHRMGRVARRADGVTFYDDSKGTNVGATVAALEGLDCRAVLIAGGDGKGQDFAPLKAAVVRHARAVVLVGRDAPRLAEALTGAGVAIEQVTTLSQAVRRAAALAQPGDAVLLSPACASLDMFRNYVHRGEVFSAAVLALDDVEAT